MIITENIFSDWLYLAINLISGVGLLAAFCLAPWRAIRSHSERQHLVYGAGLLLGLFWSLRIEGLEPLVFHPLGITAVTLMVGWSFALLAGSVAHVVMILLGFEQWSMVGVSFLLTTLIPATVSFAVVRISQRIRLRNLFVFLLGAGFLGGMLASFSVAISTMGLLYLGDGGYWANIRADIVVLFLLMFPEGFINGMVVTAVTVYKPNWVKTFDETYYLDDR